MKQVLQKSANILPKKSKRHKGILDPLVAVQRFQLNRYLPSADLAPFVEHHWTIHWDLRGQPPYISEVLPHSSVNFAFTVDRAWITGVTTGIYQYEVKDVGTIVGTMFKPGGFHPFWRQPIVMLTNKVVDVTEVFPEVDEDFRHALLGLNDDELMVAWVEELLTARKPALDQNMALIDSILETVAADKDLRTVEMVTERFYVSGRTIQYLFQKYVGVGLKCVLGIGRLMRMIRR